MVDQPKKKTGGQIGPPEAKPEMGQGVRPDVLKGILEAASFKMPDVPNLEMLKIPDLSTFGTLKMPDLSALGSLKGLSDLGTLKLPEVTFSTIDTGLLKSYRTFEDQLAGLRKQVDEQTRTLREEKSSGKNKEKKIAKLESTLEELRAKERIGFLLSRVNSAAQRQLLASGAFQNRFLERKECVAFVMSVDIRRSTELMLKARSPEAFAAFITTICADLMESITEHYGVFDKFTGDGVLAFFPDFYSGKDAAYYAVAAADKCHATFRAHYQHFRRSFSSVLTGIGLGIGVDYGAVHLVQMAGGLTVVGAPVVYACRLSGAPPGVTLVNQPAYEVISDGCGATCFIDETTIDIKHEGGMVAYAVRLNGREYAPKSPEWITSIPKEAEPPD
jgi:class 3 adenylate cyclase